MTPWDVQSKRVFAPRSVGPTLGSGTREGMNIQPCVMQAAAFAQNTRDEVRLLGGDGSYAGALSASPGAKQQTYVMASGQANAEVCEGGQAPTLTLLHEQPILFAASRATGTTYSPASAPQTGTSSSSTTSQSAGSGSCSKEG